MADFATTEEPRSEDEDEPMEEDNDFLDDAAPAASHEPPPLSTEPRDGRGDARGEGLTFLELRGADARKSLMIVGIMAAHAFGEGVGWGCRSAARVDTNRGVWSRSPSARTTFPKV